MNYFMVVVIVVTLLVQTAMLAGGRFVLKRALPIRRSVISVAVVPTTCLVLALWVHFDPQSCSEADPDMCPISYVAKMTLTFFAAVSFVAGLIVLIVERMWAKE